MSHAQPSFTYPKSDNIDPEQAKFLYENHCAIIIVQNLPVGSEFGIDLFAHRVGEKFKGVKLIPPGLHFVYASATDSNTHQSGPRCGFFHNFQPRELLIKFWSAEEEDFDDARQSSEEERQRYQSNLRDLDRYLGAYGFSTYQDFLGLTCSLTPELVEELMPTCNRIRSVPFLTRNSTSPQTSERRRTTSNDKPSEDTLLPELRPDPNTTIHFTKIPKDHLDTSENIPHHLISEYNLDSSMKLEHVFPRETGKCRLLGELQFAFATFLLCHVYESFENWKKLVALVCKADSSIPQNESFFTIFLQIIGTQLEQVPVDLFEDIVDSNNLVRCLLDTLFQNIDDLDGPSSLLRQKSAELRLQLEEKFGWSFEVERADEQPVIVEL